MKAKTAYSRLETDDEVRARGGRVADERDEDWLHRIRGHISFILLQAPIFATGSDLDKMGEIWGWPKREMATERKIIWVY